jgi:TDG/mug DNA glycosylase family protein
VTARFSSAELASFRGETVDDLVGPRPKLLFVGINPGLWTAAVNAHFARKGNRFWPALHLAGITEHLVEAHDGLSDADRRYLIRRGVAITNIVPIATARADELTNDELTVGAAALTDRVSQQRPKVVAVLGLSAYRQAFNRPKAVAGPQPDRLGRSTLFVLPNPSGLNAHETVATLAAAYGEAARVAGVID